VCPNEAEKRAGGRDDTDIAKLLGKFETKGSDKVCLSKVRNP